MAALRHSHSISVQSGSSQKSRHDGASALLGGNGSSYRRPYPHLSRRKTWRATSATAAKQTKQATNKYEHMQRVLEPSPRLCGKVLSCSCLDIRVGFQFDNNQLFISSSKLDSRAFCLGVILISLGVAFDYFIIMLSQSKLDFPDLVQNLLCYF